MGGLQPFLDPTGSTNSHVEDAAHEESRVFHNMHCSGDIALDESCVGDVSQFSKAQRSRDIECRVYGTSPGNQPGALLMNGASLTDAVDRGKEALADAMDRGKEVLTATLSKARVALDIESKDGPKFMDAMDRGKEVLTKAIDHSHGALCARLSAADTLAQGMRGAEAMDCGREKLTEAMDRSKEVLRAGLLTALDSTLDCSISKERRRTADVDLRINETRK